MACSGKDRNRPQYNKLEYITLSADHFRYPVLCWNPCDCIGSRRAGFVRFERARGVRAAVEMVWVLARRTVRCSSRWVVVLLSSGVGKGTRPRREGTDGARPVEIAGR